MKPTINFKMQKYFQYYIFLSFLVTPLFGQPLKPDAVAIHQQIKKLNFLGSVLYIAAHPDDENTRLISYFSNHVNARTGYLSLTRGDGGQNLIGTELRELLGVIRTQELIEARRIDGGVQFFTRANDFGFSKVPEETLKVWNKEQVLSDVVWTIRKFRPDVIINRFDSRTPGSTHGHHTASAMLSLEGFDLAESQNAFPEQLLLVSAWQPKRIYFNTSYWFYGGKEKFDKADKSGLYKLNTGVYYKSEGKSNQEIAALSRSRHQSQGFGSTATRGEDAEYLELIKGDPSNDSNNFFDGIDTSWNRVKNGAAIGTLINAIEKNFDFKNPEASIPELIKAYNMTLLLDDTHWRAIKSEEIKKIISASAGLFLEGAATAPDATPGSTIKVNVEAINRSDVAMTLSKITTLPGGKSISVNKVLKNNIGHTIPIDIEIPANAEYTEPYWLKEPSQPGMYQVSNQQYIGLPDVIRESKIIFEINIAGTVIPFERNIIYKYNDDVKGEVYEPFDIVPLATTSIIDKVTIFTGKKSKPVNVKVKVGASAANGLISLDLPSNWLVTPSSIPFSLTSKGEEVVVTFEVTPPKNASEIDAKSIVTIGDTQFDKEQIDIRYSHISKQMVLKSAEARFIRLDIKTGDEKIAYVMGAGDEVHKSLKQMGYDVTILKPELLTKESLVPFDVVITGIRAYNTVSQLALKQNMLLDFVKEGKTMIVQYNTLDDLVAKNMAPYPLKVSRDRVTEENAEVRFLAPAHRVLNHPNKITAEDFKGWKQEQGLYYPDQWDKAFTAIVSSNDKGEKPKNGGLLIANYGKGHYIYTGLSFFRELPEGVAGAFRLMANMISIGN